MYLETSNTGQNSIIIICKYASKLKNFSVGDSCYKNVKCQFAILKTFSIQISLTDSVFSTVSYICDMGEGKDSFFDDIIKRYHYLQRISTISKTEKCIDKIYDETVRSQLKIGDSV